MDKAKQKQYKTKLSFNTFFYFVLLNKEKDKNLFPYRNIPEGLRMY